jgi:hypothetical protein
LSEFFEKSTQVLAPRIWWVCSGLPPYVRFAALGRLIAVSRDGDSKNGPIWLDKALPPPTRARRPPPRPASRPVRQGGCSTLVCVIPNPRYNTSEACSQVIVHGNSHSATGHTRCRGHLISPTPGITYFPLTFVATAQSPHWPRSPPSDTP